MTSTRVRDAMRLMVAMFWMLVGGPLVAIGCAPGKQAPEGSGGTTKSGSHVSGCRGAAAGVQPADYIDSDRKTVVADLDCDGIPDTVRVEWVDQGRKRMVAFRARGPGIHAELIADGDALPDLVEVADLDGDGIRDVVFADVDESSVHSEALLVSKDRMAFPVSVLDVRKLQVYSWDPTEGQSDCLPHLLPRVEAMGDQLGLSAAFGHASSKKDCMAPSRVLLVIVRDTLRRLK